MGITSHLLEHVAARITSYNVCYTKLLRSQLCIFSYCWPIIARTILKSTYQIIAKDIPAQPHVKTKITPIAANAKRWTFALNPSPSVFNENILIGKTKSAADITDTVAIVTALKHQRVLFCSNTNAKGTIPNALAGVGNPKNDLDWPGSIFRITSYNVCYTKLLRLTGSAFGPNTPAMISTWSISGLV